MYLPTKFDFLQQLLVYTHALYCIRPRLLIFASSLIYVLAGKDHRVLGGRKRILGTGDWGSTALSIGGCELWSSMNHTLEQISLRREHNPRRTGKGGCEKRGPWSWPNNHSLFSVAMRCLSGLQLSPAFLSSSHSHCPCTCCSITCQPTKTQRLWIIFVNVCIVGTVFDLVISFTHSHRACILYFFQEQKFLVGVILMVPCYAVESVRCYVAALSLVQQIDTAFAVQV